MIAIALACQPSLLIADEPTTALDVTVQAQILALLTELRQRLGMAVLFITHDLGVVAEFCDRVAVMYAGRVVEVAGVSELFAAPMHPYTQGLMRSLPSISMTVEWLIPIEGEVPDAIHLPAGCYFAPRCPKAMAICREQYPDQRRVSDTEGMPHDVSCHLTSGA
jgi:peptide/nickel transport system ATP-binding protein